MTARRRFEKNMKKNGLILVSLALAALPAAGCKSGEKYRASVEFHAEGVRMHLGVVLKQVPQRNEYGMKLATAGLANAVDGLPETIRREARTRVQERLATAEKARVLFNQLRGSLNRLNYDEQDMRSKLDEFDKLITEVEKA